MEFLQAIDAIYSERRQEYNVPDNNKDFSCHIPVEVRKGTYSFLFEVRKREKAKLFLLLGKQKLYLSDIQIINIILAMGKDDIDWFLSQFILLYLESGAPFQLVLDDEIYEFHGIEIYPEEKTIYWLSDSEIEYGYFTALLNYIFSKDHCWEEISKTKDFSKKSLCKYISLIDYYHSHSERSKKFLEEIGCPITIKRPKESKEINQAFDDLTCLERFDISLYM